jgi:hypothetical protein
VVAKSQRPVCPQAGISTSPMPVMSSAAVPIVASLALHKAE